jgi:hypothetical protein
MLRSVIGLLALASLTWSSAAAAGVTASPRAEIPTSAKQRMDYLREVRLSIHPHTFYPLEGRVRGDHGGFAGYLDLREVVDLVENTDGTYYARLPKGRVVPLEGAHWRFNHRHTGALHFGRYRRSGPPTTLRDPEQSAAYRAAFEAQRARVGPLPARAAARLTLFARLPGEPTGTHAITGELVDLSHVVDVVETDDFMYYARTADHFIVPLSELHVGFGNGHSLTLKSAQTTTLRDPSQAAIYGAALHQQDQVGGE